MDKKDDKVFYLFHLMIKKYTVEVDYQVYAINPFKASDFSQKEATAGTFFGKHPS